MTGESEWKPASEAPEQLTVLVRCHNVYFHAGKIGGKWFNDKNIEVHPDSYLHHPPTMADLISVIKPAP